MFVKYNDLLRGFGAALRGCKGNRYVTTTHVINSAIVKASKLTKATKVYRGIAGGVLPESFRTPNEHGVRGGIEAAFLSCTFDRAVALHYASKPGEPGLVFEMQMGMIDRDPHERECLFAPLTGLEVVGARCEGSVLIIEARLSVNLNALTIEQVTGKRLKLLTDMASNMEVEVRAELRQKGSGFEEIGPALLRAELKQGALTEAADWYNDDACFEQACKAVVDAKRSVLAEEPRLRLLRKHADVREHAAAIEPLLDHAARPVRELAFELLLETGETAQSLRDKGHEIFSPEDWKKGGHALWELDLEVDFQGNGDRGDRLALTDDGSFAVCAGGQKGFKEEMLGEVEIKQLVEKIVGLLETGRGPEAEPLVRSAKKQGLQMDLGTGGWATNDGRTGAMHPFAVTNPTSTRPTSGADAKSIVSIVHLKTGGGIAMPKVTRLEGHEHRVCAVTVDGDQVASADKFGNVILWSISRGERVREPIKVDKTCLYSLALRGGMLYAGGRFSPIFVWYVGPEKRAALPGKLRGEYEPLHGHKSEVCSLTTDGAVLVSGSADATARVWTLAADGMPNAQCTHVLEHPEDQAVNCVRLNKGRVATACCDAAVRVWSAADGTLLHKCQHGRFTDHIDVGSVALMGTLLVSGGHANDDKSVKVWSLQGETPECVATLQGSFGAMRAGGHRSMPIRGSNPRLAESIASRL